MLLQLVLGVGAFSAIVTLLVVCILIARAVLLPAGEVEILINDDRRVHARFGSKLLTALADAGLLVAAACGGRGTCGQCRVKVLDGAKPLLPSEAAHISKRAAAGGERLACQQVIKRPMRVRLPHQVFGAHRYRCVLRSSEHVSAFIKELVLELPSAPPWSFEAGAYVQIECPPCCVLLSEVDVPDQYREEWARHRLSELVASVDKATTRAYSLANQPDEQDSITLNVRLALPPPRAGPDVPPGQVSSFLFSCKPGDEVVLTGPYGEFHVHEAAAEMVFVGGGVGMAPLRSMILDQLQRVGTRRKMSFWYGARGVRDLFYYQEFERLMNAHANFSFHVALSDPQPGEPWPGDVGFIHDIVHERYIAKHPNPEDCHYYVCGPPVMNAAVISMLQENGVEHEQIFFDDFGI